ncbi:MAG: DUF1192 domain-containing protein [Pseudomonadota bacterium]
MDEEKPRPEPVWLNEDLYEMSVGDIDERIAALKAEIMRLEEERERKQGSRAAADAFFK